MRSERFYRFCLLTGLILAAGSLGVSAQETVLSVDKEEWKVGIAILSYEDSGETEVGLRSSSTLIPRLIRDGLDEVDLHKLSSAEREQLALESLETEISASQKSLGSLIHERDRLFFDPNTDPEVLEEKTRVIDEKGTALAALEVYPPFSIQVPEAVPVVFTSAGAEFLDPVSSAPDTRRRQEGLDYLIHGSIVKVGEYFGLKILGSGPSGTDVLWEGAVGEDEIETAAFESVDVARGLLLGRSWSAVEVRINPPEATISFAGSAVGVGLWTTSILNPGTVSLEISASGYRPVIRDLVLSEGVTTSLDIELETIDTPSIIVQSDPSEADVRLGSIWLGRTPLLIGLPDRVMSLTFQKEGFREQTVPFYPDSERLMVSLESDLMDSADEMARSRKKLHNSIVWFSLSLAPTIILLGISQNYAYMNINSTDPADIAYSYDAYNLTRGLMWGSLAVNTLLLTNVFFKLSRYLKAAEGLSE